MISRRYILFLLLLGLCFPQWLRAQEVTPVRWSTQLQGDSVRAVAHIDSGWHMTLIQVGEEMLGEEYADSCVLVLPAQSTPRIRYNACDDQMCTAPEWFDPLEPLDPVEPLEHFEPLEPVAPTSTPLLTLFWLAFLAGLVAIFTPCVWPIIPMTVSFFLHRGGGKRDAWLYGASIVVIYVALGLLVTLLFGASALNTIATNAIVNIVFFLLLVVFALSFFGLFELTLPSSWVNRLDKRAQEAGGVLSIVMMALTLVIVSFSCTGPIIGTLLVEAAGRSLWAPAVGMLGFALALALPFSLLSLFPQWLAKLPRSGGWMQSLKVTLAFVELALSLKFLSVADMAYGWGILPRWLFVALWIACSLGLAIYMLIRLWGDIRRETRKIARIVRSVLAAVVMLLSLGFAIYLIPGLKGQPLDAISAFAPPLPTQGSECHTLEEGLILAQQTGQPVLVHFTGYGCVNCRKMEEQVLQDHQVEEMIEQMIHVVLYVDSRQDANSNGVEDGEENALLQKERFGANAQPYFVKLNPKGEPIGEPMGYTKHIEEFLEWIKK